MSWIFSNCSKLRSFPDISKWNIKSVIFKEGMFAGCDVRIIPKKFLNT